MHTEGILIEEVISKSETENKGSQNEQLKITEQKRRKARSKIKGDLKVFLVDDDNFFLNTLYYFLTDSISPKIQIKTFSTAEDCLRAMAEKPTIIVLDYMLGAESSKGINGLTALKRINQVAPETFVIMLSSQDSIDIALETLREGAYDYLSKSETAFIRLKTMIKNIIDTIYLSREQDKEDRLTRKINLLIIFLLIALFIISRIVQSKTIMS